MGVSDSLTRGDQCLQIVQKDTRPLSLMDKLKGEEWNIAALIESKTLKQPEDYISYENRKGQTCIRFVDYKEKSLDDLEASSSESNIEENRRHSVCEFMEKLDIDNEIKHYEQKLSKIPDEYNTSMLCEW